jgi:hypothetical protein
MKPNIRLGLSDLYRIINELEEEIKKADEEIFNTSLYNCFFVGPEASDNDNICPIQYRQDTSDWCPACRAKRYIKNKKKVKVVNVSTVHMER